MTLTSPSDLGATRHLMVSQRLRERRRTLGLTQKQVISRLARLGVFSTNKALSSLEHGSGLDVAKLPELAAALDCSVTWLLGLTDDPHSWEPAGRRPTAGPRTRAVEAEVVALATPSALAGTPGVRPLPRILGPLSGSE
jgi:transcriptional regulator with XRE-family HTH domain